MINALSFLLTSVKIHPVKQHACTDRLKEFNEE